MSGRRAADHDVEQLRQAIKSFGFTVVARGPRIFVLWPGAEEIYICKKLPRVGFWELNQVNRNLWELYGAIGVPVFPYIAVHELIKWFYDRALDIPEIIEGLKLSASTKQAARYIANARYPTGRVRDYKEERRTTRRRRRNKELQEAESRDRKRQDNLRDRINRTGETTSRKRS